MASLVPGSCCLASRKTVSAMKRNWRTALFTFGSIVVGGGVLLARQIGDVPAIPAHMSEADIESGRVSFQAAVKHGEKLFTAVFNRLDGQGRPATTADGQPRSQLGTPGPVILVDPARRQAAQDGEILFNSVGCTDCHVPAMKLNSRMFAEANPFNPEWKIPFAVAKRIAFDMTKDGELPRLEPTPDGGAVVRAYTDLKRHSLCDERDQFFCNEKVAQPGIPLSTFLTRKLWDIGSSAAFGHRGDLSTITEAIEHHAGEGRLSLTNYLNLSSYQRAAIVEFLKTLQVLPPEPARVIDEAKR